MYCGSMLVYDSDASSKKTIYTYITVSRNTQPAESRIYDEIPQSKVRWCYSQVSTTTPNRESWVTATGQRLGVRDPTKKYHVREMILRVFLWGQESGHVSPAGSLLDLRPHASNFGPGSRLDVMTKSKAPSIGDPYQGSLWYEGRVLCGHWPVNKLLRGFQVHKTERGPLELDFLVWLQQQLILHTY